jgi:micrococcal nuclease
MKKLFALALFCSCLCMPAKAVAWQGAVSRVIDGNTLLVYHVQDTTNEMTVRLYGVQAPQSGQPWADRAKEYLELNLSRPDDDVYFGRSDAVEILPMYMDREGRLVALVYACKSAVMLNSGLLNEGLARVDAQSCRAEPMCQKWREYQKDAERFGTGMWAGQTAGAGGQ